MRTVGRLQEQGQYRAISGAEGRGKHWQACLPNVGLISTRLYNIRSFFIVKVRRTSNLEYRVRENRLSSFEELVYIEKKRFLFLKLAVHTI
jgi:hypothetical protein